MSKDAWQRFSDKGYKHYQVVECGYKYNMMDIQAAIGIHQLKKVEDNWKRREEIWHLYNEAFKDLPIDIPSPIENRTRHAYHLYTILIDHKKIGVTRDDFLEKMTDNKIGVGVHYLSIPEHPYYQKTFGWRAKSFPHARRIGRQTVSLPISPRLNNKEIFYICETVKRIVLG